MTFHIGHNITIDCPLTEDRIDATVSFDYYKGYEQTWSEPGCDPEIELCTVVVDGVDIIDTLTTWQIDTIQSEIMEGMFNDDDFDEPDKDDYPEEWSYNAA